MLLFFFLNDALSNVSSPGESGVVCFSKVSGTCCLSAGKMGMKKPPGGSTVFGVNSSKTGFEMHSELSEDVINSL